MNTAKVMEANDAIGAAKDALREMYQRHYNEEEAIMREIEYWETKLEEAQSA